MAEDNNFWNFISFWIFGLCNNFGYVVMLSAAKDILAEETTNGTAELDDCIMNSSDIKCSKITTGAVLLADIIPSFIIKLLTPFLFQSISYTIRHAFVVIFQALSFFIVAFSNSFLISIFGIIIGSVACGLGETSSLSLSSHFSNNVILSWSSGTGGAGVFGALYFAVLTDRRLLALTPQSALLLLTIIPLVSFLTFWKLLVFPSTVHRFNFCNWKTYFNPSERLCNFSESEDVNNNEENNLFENALPDNAIDTIANLDTPLLLSSSAINDTSPTNPNVLSTSVNVGLGLGIKQMFFNWFKRYLQMIRPLIVYMVSLFFVYYAEYFINQGILELLIFVCSKSFSLSPSSQYRWYQVLYQVGVFISRSSVKWFSLHYYCLPLISFLQVINAVILYKNALNPFIGHIIFVFVIVFYEGLLGGAAYVNTFNTLHRTIKQNREFSMGFVALADSVGIILAGFTSFLAHNQIC